MITLPNALISLLEETAGKSDQPMLERTPEKEEPDPGILRNGASPADSTPHEDDGTGRHQHEEGEPVDWIALDVVSTARARHRGSQIQPLREIAGTREKHP